MTKLFAYSSRSIIFALGLIFLFMSCENETTKYEQEDLVSISAKDKKNKKNKVDVCHYDSATATWKTLNISVNALDAHLNHGDFSGACETDSDGDGVPDFLDLCPDTPMGVEVDDQGCPINLRPFIFSFKDGFDPIEAWTVGGAGPFTVDWGDGQIDTDVTGNITHIYDVPSREITIAITSTNPVEWHSGDARYNTYMIHQWGDIKWSTMANFLRLEHVDMIATDVPDLSNCTSLANMFSNTYGQMSGSLGNWDVSTITDMSGMFRGRAVYADLSGWDVSNVTNMEEMFEGDLVNMGAEPDFIYYSSPRGLSCWDVSSATNMARMFQNTFFNQDISKWDVSNIINVTSMFEGAIEFNQDLSAWNLDNVFLCVDFSANTPKWTLPKPTFNICTP